MKICLDAGHGEGYNPSPADPRYREGTRMFELQALLKRALQSYGFEVVCSRNRIEESPSLQKRAAAGIGCDLLLSLHTNAVGNEVSDTVDYVCVFHPISGDKKELAQSLAEVIASVMHTEQLPQIRSRKNSAGTADYYGILRHATAFGISSLLIEHSFHTNTRITQWLLNDDNLQLLAEAEAAMIAEYFGMEEWQMRYEKLRDVQNPYYRPTVEKLLRMGVLQGKGGAGEDTVLDLGEDAIRLLVVLDRAGVFENNQER
ncbi:MAG: N-acetylmuramoyl-L-alanine amidase [Ruminococcaceae bacterium]|nr:N-acetylmuramoyl-L-alanine amidase [Oscillospiraceae bacterium]